MSMVNVWSWVILAVFVVGAEPSNEDSECQSKLTKDCRRQLSVRAVDQAVTTFFAGGRHPEGIPGGVQIAQRIPTGPTGTTYFFTLFNPTRNIPLYSAYKVTPTQAAGIGTNKRQKFTWRNPKDASGQGIPVEKVYKEAVKTQRLSRGHLNPSDINSFDLNFMKATYTLTNAVPQFATLNTGSWKEYENRVRDYAKCPCGSDRGGTLYLLTGISDHGLEVDSNGRPIRDDSVWLRFKTNIHHQRVKVDIPRAVWTAGCCVWKEPGSAFGSASQSEKAESFAVMTNNRDNQALLHQTEMSVAKLEELLTTSPSSRVNLFPGKPKCRNPDNLDFKIPL